MKRSEQNLAGDYGLVGVGRAAGFKLMEVGGVGLVPTSGHRLPAPVPGTPQVLHTSSRGDTEHMPLRVIKGVAFLPASSILPALAFTRYLPRLPPLINRN